VGVPVSLVAMFLPPSLFTMFMNGDSQSGHFFPLSIFKSTFIEIDLFWGVERREEMKVANSKNQLGRDLLYGLIFPLMNPIKTIMETIPVQ
jgi:hypothetical protein